MRVPLIGRLAGALARAVTGAMIVAALATGPVGPAAADPASAPAAGPATSTRVHWNEPTQPFRVIGNVYYVGTAELSSWLIADPSGLVLIDGALPESVPQIERNIEALGFRVRDVRILLNSHAHFDHSGGLAALKRATGASLYASSGDRSALESGSYLGSEDDHSFDAPPVHVDRVIGDGELVRLGRIRLTAHVTPGHTRGCTTWSLPVVERGTKREVLFYCSTSVAANRLVTRPQYPGVVADYRATFDRLAAMKADVFLSNHESFFDRDAKRARQVAGDADAFVDPGELARFVQASRAAFERDLAAQERAVAAQP